MVLNTHISVLSDRCVCVYIKRNINGKRSKKYLTRMLLSPAHLYPNVCIYVMITILNYSAWYSCIYRALQSTLTFTSTHLHITFHTDVTFRVLSHFDSKMKCECSIEWMARYVMPHYVCIVVYVCFHIAIPFTPFFVVGREMVGQKGSKKVQMIINTLEMMKHAREKKV